MSDNSNQLDESKLATYLEKHIAGFQGPLTADKFPDGQSNPTYKLKAASGDYVLRRKPPGKLLASAHAVDREFRVIDALRSTDVPVADALHLCEDDNVIGSAFYVMSFVEGAIYWQASLPDLANEVRGTIYHELVNTLARIHRVNLTEVGLTDYGKSGNYFARQVDRWSKQYRQSETRVIPAMDKLIEWLPQHTPADDQRISLIHGDYRLDNIIFCPGTHQVKAVLDWELSTLGHPFADIAYFCMCLRLPSEGLMPGLMDIDRAPLGIPEEKQLLQHYCQIMEVEDIDNWNFYLAFCFFRLAAIAQGVMKRSQQGNASSAQAETVGKMAETLATMAVALI